MHFEPMNSEELLEKRLSLHDQLTQNLTFALDLQRSNDTFFYVTLYPSSTLNKWYELPAEVVDKIQIISSERYNGITIAVALFTLKSPSLTSLLISLFQDANPAKQLNVTTYSSQAESFRMLSRSFIFYAPPLVFSPWVVVASHGGRVTYTINFKPQGDTQIQAQVRYFEFDNLPKVERDILSGTSITTSNSFANVEMRFKGIPTGSAVDVSIEP